MNLTFGVLTLLATSSWFLLQVSSQNHPNYQRFVKNNRPIRQEEQGSIRLGRQTKADQMVQNILQWLQGVYTQNSRKIRQGTIREYLPPIVTEKPRPFEPSIPETPEDNTVGYPTPPPGVYPPLGPTYPEIGPGQPSYPPPEGIPEQPSKEEPSPEEPIQHVPPTKPEEPGYPHPVPPVDEQTYPRPGYPEKEPEYPGKEPSAGTEPSEPESITEPEQLIPLTPEKEPEAPQTPQQPSYPIPEEPGKPEYPEKPEEPIQPGYPTPEEPGYPEKPEEPVRPSFPIPEEPGYQQPEKPAQPGYPTPEEPGYPEKPEEPIQPSFPTPEKPRYPETEEPVQPSFPTPEEPGYPEKEKPIQPSFPTPEEPGYPEKGEPVQPSFPTPEKPEYPEKEEPVQPGYPTPEEPGYPEKEKPIQPSFPTPEEPGYPEKGEPVQPSFPTPEKPEYPEKEEPVQPGYPTPEEPQYPEKPVQPDYPSPERPEYPEEPVQPSYPTPEEPGYPSQTEVPYRPEETTDEIPQGPGYPPSGQTPQPPFGLPTEKPQPELPQQPPSIETEKPYELEIPLVTEKQPPPEREETEPTGYPTEGPGLTSVFPGVESEQPIKPSPEPRIPEGQSPETYTSGPSITTKETPYYPGDLITSGPPTETEPGQEHPGTEPSGEPEVPKEPPQPPEDDLSHPPHIHALDVICDQDKMMIIVEFNRQFDGIIYSKGHYNDLNCRYVNENSGQTKYEFTVYLNQCGTELISSGEGINNTYLENVLVMQNEVGIQEVWDTVRAVRCQWEQSLKKSLTTSLSVGMLKPEIVTFSGDSIMARLDIQQGEGPFAPTVNGLVPIGEKMTLVVSITGADGYDVQVKDCRAKDTESSSEIALSDEDGCILKPKLFGAFQKLIEPGGPILAYAFFNAFKFPDIMDLMIECNIELCKTECEICPDPNQKLQPGRRRRDLSNETLTEPVRVGKLLRVLLPEDLSNGEAIVKIESEAQNVCVSIKTFVIATTAMISLLTTASIFSAYHYLKYRRNHCKY